MAQSHSGVSTKQSFNRNDIQKKKIYRRKRSFGQKFNRLRSHQSACFVFCCLFILTYYNYLLCCEFCVEWKIYTLHNVHQQKGEMVQNDCHCFLTRLLSLKWPSIQIFTYSQCRHRNVSDHIYKVKSHTHIHILKLIVSA